MGDLFLEHWNYEEQGTELHNDSRPSWKIGDHVLTLNQNNRNGGDALHIWSSTTGIGCGGQRSGVSGWALNPNGVGVEGWSKPQRYRSGSDIPFTGLSDGGAGTGTGVRGVTGTGFGVEGWAVSPGSSWAAGNLDSAAHQNMGSGTGVMGISGTGIGVYGKSFGKAWDGTPKVGNGVNGEAEIGVGVVGTAKKGDGVYGRSDDGDGVVGVSRKNGNAGVVGFNANEQGTGVVGSSEGWGVRGWSNGDNGVVGTANKEQKAGVYGTCNAKDGIGVYGNTDLGVGVAGVTRRGIGIWAEVTASGLSSEAPTIALLARGTVAGIFQGDVVIQGNVTVAAGYGLTVQTPGNKHGVVALADGSRRLVCAIESPEAWFEDFGEAKLANGTANVALDSDFAQTVDTTEYHVFLTPHDDSNGLYIARRTRTGFKVAEQQKGRSNIVFSWRLVARPKTAKRGRFARDKNQARIQRAIEPLARTRTLLASSKIDPQVLNAPIVPKLTMPKLSEPKKPPRGNARSRMLRRRKKARS
jgi:hypothetical protein